MKSTDDRSPMLPKNYLQIPKLNAQPCEILDNFLSTFLLLRPLKDLFLNEIELEILIDELSFSF